MNELTAEQAARALLGLVVTDPRTKDPNRPGLNDICDQHTQDIIWQAVQLVGTPTPDGKGGFVFSHKPDIYIPSYTDYEFWRDPDGCVDFRPAVPDAEI